MSFNIGTGYKTYNFTQYGNSGMPTEGNGYLQMNDGANQTLIAGTYIGNKIIAADAGDTIDLSNSGIWRQVGYQTSDTGAAGIRYDKEGGGSILVSGGATVKTEVKKEDPKAENTNPTYSKEAIKEQFAAMEGNKDGVMGKEEFKTAIDALPDTKQKTFWKENFLDKFDEAESANDIDPNHKDGFISVGDVLKFYRLNPD